MMHYVLPAKKKRYIPNNLKYAFGIHLFMPYDDYFIADFCLYPSLRNIFNQTRKNLAFEKNVGKKITIFVDNTLEILVCKGT